MHNVIKPSRQNIAREVPNIYPIQLDPFHYQKLAHKVMELHI